MSKSIIFNGSIPQYYEDIPTSFLFDPFAQDLVSRIEKNNVRNVLELALKLALIGLLGNLPLHSPLQALVFETTK